MADLPAVPPETIDWIRRESPTVIAYADTGVGKTQLAGTLFERGAYYPVLYIDADDGAATISEFVQHSDACDYRNFNTHKRPGEDDFAWFIRELKAAATAKCGSIVVEGISRFYQDAVGHEFQTDPRVSGHKTRSKYQIPAQMLMAMIITFADIKRRRKTAGTGVPTYGSLNVNESRDTEVKPPVTWLSPAISENKIRRLMERTDAFVELTRIGKTTRLHGDPAGRSWFRKVRSPVACAALRTKSNPTLPWLFDTWAAAEKDSGQRVSSVLDQIIAQQLELNAQQNPSTEQETP